MSDDVAVPSWTHRFPPVSYWVKIGAVIIGIFVALKLLVILQSILVVLAASTVLAIGLQPAIGCFERRRVPRGLALSAIMLAGLAVAVGTAVLIVPLVVEQVSTLAAAIPEQLESLQQQEGIVGDLAGRLDAEGLPTTMPEGALDAVGGAFAAAFQLVLVLTLTPYFALSMPRAKRWAVRLLVRRDREEFLRMLNRSTALMANYIVGNLLVSVIAGVITYVGLRLLGVPYAAALAVFVAVTDVIPAIGATLGAVVVIGVAATQGASTAIGALLLTLLYQQVENFLIVPRVMRDAIDVRPATGIVALLVGGTLAGPVGALLALPVAAMAKIVIEEFVLRDRMATVRAEDAAEERIRAAGASSRARTRRTSLP